MNRIIRIFEFFKGIAGNHWNGYSKGLNKNNHQEGLYPGFKTIESIVKSHFKIFQDEWNFSIIYKVYWSFIYF